MQLNTIASEFGPRLSSLAHRMIRNSAVADEAAQEAWVEIVKSLRSFNDRSRISTWIYTVAKRTILRYARKERTYSGRLMESYVKAEELRCPEGRKGEEREWAREKCDECLSAFLTCLEPSARLALLFRSLVELPYAQIAEVLGETETYTRQVISRARRKVTSYMARNCSLFRADAGCRCRLRGYSEEIDRLREYTKLERIVSLAVFLRKTERGFPRLAFWEERLKR